MLSKSVLAAIISFRKPYFNGGVAGQGEYVDAPADFKGYSRTYGTGIVIDSIDFDFDPNGQPAPYPFRIIPQIRVAGMRESTRPLDPERHPHVKYELTYADGSPIEHMDELKDARTQAPIDPYTDYGNVGYQNVFNDGDYKLTVTAAIMADRSLNKVWQTQAVYEFTMLKNNCTRVYFDATNGNSSNDGLDPLGLALTNASYVEATGVISETGKFAGVTLSSEPYMLKSNRWLHLTGYGYVLLDNIIDANSATINERYKLGSDLTGLTSSTGPKAGSDFSTVVIDQYSYSNVLYLASGINNDAYTKTLFVRRGDATVGYMSYGTSLGGKPTLTNPAATYLVNLTSNPTDGGYATDVILSDFILDGEEDQGGFSGILSSKEDIGHPIRIWNDGLEFVNTTSNSCIFIPIGGAVNDVYYYGYAEKPWNLRTNVLTYTTAEDVFIGENTVQVTTTIDTVTQGEAWFKIENGSDSETHFLDGYTSDVFTIQGESRGVLKPTFQKNYPAGSTVTVGDSKAMGHAISAKGIAVRGAVFNGDADVLGFDHQTYYSFYGNNNYMCYNRAENDGAGTTHMYNNNANNPSGPVHRNNISFNHVQPDACEFFCEGGTSLNKMSEGYFTSNYMCGNSGSPRNTAYYTFTVLNAFIRDDEFWFSDPSFEINAVNTYNSAGSNEDWLNYTFEFEMENIKCYSRPLFLEAYDEDVNGGQFMPANIEALNCSTYITNSGTTPNVKVNFNEGVTTIFEGCNFYAPNYGSGLQFRDETGLIDLATFNSRTGFTNTANDPEWTDPANGDFSTEITTYFTNFSDDTLGQIPADSALRRSGATGDYRVIDLSGQNVLVFYAGANTSVPHALEFTPLTCEGVTEAYALLRDVNSGPSSARLMLFAQDSPQNEYGCIVSAMSNNVVLYRRVSGSYTALATVGKTIDSTLQYHVTFKVTPGSPNQLEAYVWEDGTSKPVTPTISANDSTYATPVGYAGFVGFNVNDANPVYYYRYGLGINGSSAPTE